MAYLIGITGGSGSGKTSLIKALRIHFQESQLCIISQDDYYLPRDKQETDEAGIRNFDLPHSIDHDAFLSDLKGLMNGKIIRRPKYTFNNELATPETVVMKPAPVIILEGLFVFHRQDIRELLNLRVFVHAKENLKVIRRIKRDQVSRNYPLEDVLYRYEKHVLPTFERYISHFREEADIVINNNAHFENGLRVLTGYIEWITRPQNHDQ